MCRCFPTLHSRLRSACCGALISYAMCAMCAKMPSARSGSSQCGRRQRRLSACRQQKQDRHCRDTVSPNGRSPFILLFLRCSFSHAHVLFLCRFVNEIQTLYVSRNCLKNSSRPRSISKSASSFCFCLLGGSELRRFIYPFAIFQNFSG